MLLVYFLLWTLPESLDFSRGGAHGQICKRDDHFKDAVFYVVYWILWTINQWDFLDLSSYDNTFANFKMVELGLVYLNLEGDVLICRGVSDYKCDKVSHRDKFDAVSWTHGHILTNMFSSAGNLLLFSRGFFSNRLWLRKTLDIPNVKCLNLAQLSNLWQVELLHLTRLHSLQ